VTVRDLMQSYAPLKNQRVEAEAALNALSAIDYGKWSLLARQRRAGDQPDFSSYCLIYETVVSKSIRAVYEPKQAKATQRKTLLVRHAAGNHLRAGQR
jgi:hypothetical protein